MTVSFLLNQDHPLDEDPLLDQDHGLAWEEEEAGAWYRSEPNLARYPVKAPPSEETMRVLAQVGRVRHQRRHSDVSLAAVQQNQHQLPPQHQGRTSICARVHPSTSLSFLPSIHPSVLLSVHLSILFWSKGSFCLLF